MAADRDARLVWLVHQRGCDRCREFEGVLCADGSKLFNAAKDADKRRTLVTQVAKLETP